MRNMHFWAKTTPDGQPGIAVRDHCLNVGCVAETLLSHVPPPLPGLLPPGAAILAALHDVGKVSPGFQQKCPAWLAQAQWQPQLAETDHAKVSQWFLQQWLGQPARDLKRWLMAVGAHHGQSKGSWIKDARGGGVDISRTGDSKWQDARYELADAVAAFFAPGTAPSALFDSPPPNDAVLGYFAGLVTVADWIGSDERFFSPAVEAPPLDPEQRRARAARAVAAIGLDQPPFVRSAAFTELFPPLAAPNALQQTAAARCRQPGLWILEAPMGCGKTEAALLAAGQLLAEGQARGLYFALPTQTTSNRIFERVARWLERLLHHHATLRLAHGASWLEDREMVQVRPGGESESRENPWAAQYWFASARRALLAPFGVGTVDQALLGVVAARHFFVRLFGLAGKVVVLDEVHSYDLYTGTLLDLLIEQLLQLRCTVIVLSATLTRQRREQLLEAAHRALGLETTSAHVAAPPDPAADPYPLLTGVTAAAGRIQSPLPLSPAPHHRVRLRCEEIPFEEAATECVRRAEAGQVVLWVRNTVDAAQRSFDALRGVLREGGPETALLHSRFPWFRRDALEDHWLKRLGKDAADRPRGAVLVATQVVEQSVDIDADFLLTDLAPTDMLLQRLGRLWRHPRPDRPNQADGPEAWIHAPNCERLPTAPLKQGVQAIKASLRGLAPPYDAYVLLRSAREWKRWAGQDGICLPDDIRALLEATYAPWQDEPTAWQILREEMERRAQELRGKAFNASNAWTLPQLSDDEGVQTRVSEYSTLTLVLLQSVQSGRGTVQLTTLEGVTVTARERDWSRDVAAALHRSHVKIPAWWLKGRTPDNPPALKPYFVGPWALATVDGDHLWLDGREGENAGLKYLPDRGVWRQAAPGQAPTPDYPDDDELND